MKYFKDSTGTVYAYEADGSQDAFIKPELVQLTDEEVYTHLNPAKTPDDIRAELKHQRDLNVSQITVTVAEMLFDGDEVSQNRMARAICAMDDLDTTSWTLADNSVVTVTKEQLKEALRLAGIAQTELWSLEV